MCDHNLNEFFNVGPGVAYVGCTKCSYWEPYNNPTENIIVEVFDAEGNLVETSGVAEVK